MKAAYKSAIIGKNGYVGRELVRLVQRHPYLQLLDPANIQDCLQNSSDLDVVFLATPADVSMKAVSALMNSDIKIIDLSGAFRLSEDDFTSWYGMKHEASCYIEKACYGLSPWATSQSKAQLIANPGCYATGALMSLLPLLKTNIIDNQSIIIDAKSGVSGAGKKPVFDLMFCEIANNFYPYKIGQHQHTPEIEKAIKEFSNQQATITLTTSMLPMVRGIALTIYLQATASFLSDQELTESILNAFDSAYKSYPLVCYKEVGNGSPEEDHKVLALQQILLTPYCHIGFFVKNGQIILFSSIDNLLKGAASQAIENLNAMYQLPLQTGLVDKEHL